MWQLVASPCLNLHTPTTSMFGGFLMMQPASVDHDLARE